MFRNHEENTISISYEMMDLGNGFTKIASLGGNGQEILCLEEKHEENSILRTYVSKKLTHLLHYHQHVYLDFVLHGFPLITTFKT